VDYELIIVDNGTGVRDLPGVVIQNDLNRGFARACNQGAEVAKSDVLVFLNNDTQPCGGWLSTMLSALGEPGVAAVGCKLVYPNGRIQHAGTAIVQDHNGRLRGLNETEDLPRRTVSAVSAAAMAVRRHAFERVGGFDEGYWNSHEDVDLCLKLGEAGWTILYEPAAVVRHDESASKAERFSGIQAARQRFNDQWVGKVAPSRALPAPASPPRARRLVRRVAGRIKRLVSNTSR
jgi:GT2 family glycosyltransferase